MTDKIMIGAGLYGLYSALFCAKRGQSVALLEIEEAPFTRATYINQARVHMGYHYPRSLSTALKSAGYFKRFVEDYSFCIHSAFKQIYATSSHFSWTDAKEFKMFCKAADIPCLELPVEQYFKEGQCDGAFLTEEYTYDAHILRDYLMGELKNYPNVKLYFKREITRIIKKSTCYEVYAMHEGKEECYQAPFVLNATYASVNQVLKKVEGVTPELFKLKYELCEIILCQASDKIRDIGFTVMDGPFFSIMPFGKTGYHSLTSVTFTPHKTSYDITPKFNCVNENGYCTQSFLGNCDFCPRRPESAWEYMSALARKYMNDEYEFSYEKSLFSMKPILKASEIDDSRPTVIRSLSEEPTFISVLSGKINTVYDLDEFLV
ncbi:MAG: FAD-dependent oxidoreductase [Lachnospiraceae bacterium]|nr:FAD-dependent oxidoreductase [Lachnospiraceae bacterium]